MIIASQHKMSSHSTLFFLALNLSASSSHPTLIPSMRVRNKRHLHLDILRPRCTESKDVTNENSSVEYGIKRREILKDDSQRQDLKMTLSENYNSYHNDKKITDGIRVHVTGIKSMLKSMNDGELSVSAYDTAWVAMVEEVNGGGRPQFPAALQWIADNQLLDGSWGDPLFFSAYDRIINSLACVVALKHWRIHSDKCVKGISFLRANMWKLGEENPEHMTCGFEVAFPLLIEIARKLEIEIPYESPVFQDIYARRDEKLKRISTEKMHNVATGLLFSLEGMPDLKWEELLRLRNEDGSFLSSPSSTAFAFMQTKDENCLNYLRETVQRFNGGVPNLYPVDLYERLWAVDRLQRLGISRYFEEEIEDCMRYVYRYWSNRGIGWARNTRVDDLDDTCMGFRLLRLHGYEVSTDVFKQFKSGDEFFTMMGQSTEGVTVMFNLYRASQLRFPGEKILADAKEYAIEYLRRKREANKLFDKWVITKDLPGEVGYALNVPWYVSLPRVETRFYIDQYGGKNVIWIGKTLYRAPYINNNVYLELAKLDYNNCQALHLLEWDHIQRWYSGSKLAELYMGIGSKTLLYSYFTAAASIYEPQRSRERVAWAKTSILVDAIGSYFSEVAAAGHFVQRKAFAQQFRVSSSKNRHHINGSLSLLTPNKEGEVLIETLIATLDQLSLEVFVASGQDISHQLRHAWEKWLMGCEAEGEEKHKGMVELLVQMIALAGDGDGHRISRELLSHPQYRRLCDLTNTICLHLAHLHQHRKVNEDEISKASCQNIGESIEVERSLQELVQLVLQNSTDDIDKDLKDTFLIVMKSFYYTTYFDKDTIDFHITKVLFEKVD